MSDIRKFLTGLKLQHQDQYLEIPEILDIKRYQITAFAKKMEDAGQNRVLLFENINNVLGEKSEFPLLFNVFATRELCALALGLSRKESKTALTDAFAAIEQRKGELQRVPCEEAAVKEVKWNQIDVRRFPVPMCHEEDVGPYFTMTNIMKSKTGGFYDITFTKNLIYGPRHLSISAHGHHHLRKMITDYEDAGESAPVVIVLGHHPAFFLSACALMPYGNDDYQTAAAFMGEPVRLTPSETWGDDFLVPADAEIIIEGLVLPRERREQNPFGEISGHYQGRMMSPVIEVTAVTHRQEAIMQGIFPGHPEHWILGGMPKEGSVLNAIRKTIPSVRAVHLPMSGCGRFSCFIALSEGFDAGEVNKAAMVAFAEMPNLKLCVVVDEDIDVYNEREVFWAVSTQTHWDRDLQLINNVQTFRPWLGDAVVIINATCPRDPAFPRHNKIPAEALARVDVSSYLR